jgi:hypothetical protein
MVVLFFLMRSINRYYARVTDEIAADDDTPTLPPSVHGLVLISRLHKPGLRALSFARATHPDVLEAVTIAVHDEDTRELLAEWDRRGVPVPLKVLEAPYRDMLRAGGRACCTTRARCGSRRGCCSPRAWSW